MAELITMIQKIVKNVINDTLQLKYLQAEVTSLTPLTFVSDRYTIKDKQIIFTEIVTPTVATLQLKEMDKDYISFVGCKGHTAEEYGIGTSGDFTLEQITKDYHLYLNRPLEVGDKVYLQKLNSQYLYLGRVGNPYNTVTLELKEGTPT